MTSDAIRNMLKERRFATTARILGEDKAKGVTVKLIDMPNGGAAWWNSAERHIVLNDALPHTDDDKLKLTWERAKLFHELFHVMFTDNEKLRAKFHKQANDGNRYLWVSNALEDGRIEYHGGKLYGGTIGFIRTLLAKLVNADTPDCGLLLYVRTKLWRNAKEAKFWAKYQAQIDEAITAPNSSKVWKIAFDIVQDMEKPQPKQNEPEGKPEPAKGKPEQDEESEDEQQQEESKGETSPAGQKNESETDESESEEQEESEEGDTEGDSANQDDTDSDESEEEGQDSGGQSDEPHDEQSEEDEQESESQSSAPPTSAKLDKEIQEQLEEIVKRAMSAVSDEVDEELIEIEQEASTYVQEQEYANPVEERNAGELTEVFASLLVESSRQRFEPCKRGGKLDPRRLLEAKTDGVFMHERVENPSQPHVVLLIDQSYSMINDMKTVSSAARVLTGAITDSGARTITFGFGAHNEPEKIDAYTVIPKEGLDHGFSTPTEVALKTAHNWLLEETAKRGMVIVITDGEPNKPEAAIVRFEELKRDGFYVLNVMLGEDAKNAMVMAKGEAMCHTSIQIKNASDLIRALDAPLGDFISGAF